jgi:hypothetical protein
MNNLCTMIMIRRNDSGLTLADQRFGLVPSRPTGKTSVSVVTSSGGTNVVADCGRTRLLVAVYGSRIEKRTNQAAAQLRLMPYLPGPRYS